MEKTRLLLLTAALLSAMAALPASSLKYHSYNEVEKLFRSLESTHPRLAKLHSIGQSVQGMTSAAALAPLLLLLLTSAPLHTPSGK